MPHLKPMDEVSLIGERRKRGRNSSARERIPGNDGRIIAKDWPAPQNFFGAFPPFLPSAHSIAKKRLA
jgi:hypothetical protein